MLTLTVKALHLKGEHSEIRGTFDTNEVSIGRRDECDIVLPDPDHLVSDVQARILLQIDGRYVVSNVSTSNPMYVNGAELAPDSSQAIGDGDQLRAGSYVLTVSMADKGSQPIQRNGGQEVFVTSAGSAQPSEAGQAGANVDPLAAFGLSTDTSLQANVNPFADLLPEAAPINSTPGTGKNVMDAGELPPPTARDDFSDKEIPEKSLPIYYDNSETVPIPDESPLTGQKPLAPPQVTGEPGLPPSKEIDPDDPFGDLLAAPLPVGRIRETASAITRNAEFPPLSGQDTDIERLSENDVSQPGVKNVLANPFELPVADSSGASCGQKKHAGPALSGLAGDPFADLMGAPVESHIANAPLFEPVPFQKKTYRKTYIPEDFNPLAAGGVSQRNSSDPLTPMGVNAKGLADVIPNSTIDSIYNPGSESPTTLAVDPLQHTQERVLRVEQSVDPLKLFGNDDSRLMPGQSDANTGSSIRNDALEMVASFRAPVSRVDPDMHAAEPAENIIPASPEFIPPASADLPTDVEASAVPAMMPLPSGINDGINSTPVSPPSWPSVDFADANPDVVMKSKFGQDSMQPGAAVPFAPDPSAIDSPIVTKPLVDFPSSDVLESEIQDAQALMAAFKRGAGLEEWSADPVTPELMETLGRLLETAVQGTVALLAARAAIKQEIHLAVTLINPKSNNPLKFLPDGHTALLQMLGPKIPGYMAPVAAMKEAFRDLLIHQTAIAAGTQAMVKALFHRFNPDSIKSQYSKNGISEKLSQTSYYARLWSTYTNQYRLLEEEIKDDFFKRMGTEFHDAYNREYNNHADDEK